MGFISHYITPLVIIALGWAHTHAHMQTRIPMTCTESILRNQVFFGWRIPGLKICCHESSLDDVVRRLPLDADTSRLHAKW